MKVGFNSQITKNNRINFGNQYQTISQFKPGTPAIVNSYITQETIDTFSPMNKKQALARIEDETEEAMDELKKGDKKAFLDEFSDILYNVHNTARLFGIDPYQALQGTNEKNRKRHNAVVKMAEDKDIQIDNNSSEYRKLWTLVKKSEEK